MLQLNFIRPLNWTNAQKQAGSEIRMLPTTIPHDTKQCSSSLPSLRLPLPMHTSKQNKKKNKKVTVHVSVNVSVHPGSLDARWNSYCLGASAEMQRQTLINFTVCHCGAEVRALRRNLIQLRRTVLFIYSLQYSCVPFSLPSSRVLSLLATKLAEPSESGRHAVARYSATVLLTVHH